MKTKELAKLPTQCPSCDSFHFTGRFCEKCSHSDFLKGTMCSLAQDCYNDDQLGTFLFTGDTAKDVNDKESRCSPLCKDEYELFMWMKTQKFTRLINNGVSRFIIG